MGEATSARGTLTLQSGRFSLYSLETLYNKFPYIKSLPYSLKILLENLLRHQESGAVTQDQIERLACWDPNATPDTEIAFTPARVILQDFTGVPAVVDLAAMRDAMGELGGDASKINPLSPAELVIDHSIQVDVYNTPDAMERNTRIEFERNRERYEFLRWGQNAFDNFKVVPPSTGIVHQVNIEYLARVVFEKDGLLYPDTLVGTDSHTTMVNGLGVLGWGVGGIEAEAAMLGQPITMLIPQVVGVELHGKLPQGATATDLVLTVTEMLRAEGVVGKFVEFFGDGLNELPLADRATLGNMSPEFGSTCAIFPIDAETIRYLKLTGRSTDHIERVETYAKAQGLWREPGAAPARYSSVVRLDLTEITPSIAGPKRPQDRIALSAAQSTITSLLHAATKARNAKDQNIERWANEGGDGLKSKPARKQAADAKKSDFELNDGDVVIAAITSCTNTSNPAVMIGAGLLARNAIERGLDVKPWVKTSLAPGSKVVTDYLEKSELMDDLEALGFSLVGYGCTTCIGNSGPLRPEISQAIHANDLVACAVLSGNRNFEGRIHPDVKMNFLASPPLVVAYALAGSMTTDLLNEPLGRDKSGAPVYLKDIWPTLAEIQDFVTRNVDSQMFKQSYSDVFEGDALWKGIDVPTENIYTWPKSTYVKQPPYFVNMKTETEPVADIENARVLALLGDSVTTDHISPAGAIKKDSPAGRYLIEHGVEPKDFNSYGSRRGNHEVMMRGTFANIRLRNLLAAGTEGGVTIHLPSGEEMSIFDAAMKYQQDDTALIVIAGSEYGSGSSRDWAAKGTLLLGVKSVIAKSYERIHRSNLIGMGVMPLEFEAGQDAQVLGLTGSEIYAITGLNGNERQANVRARNDNEEINFTVNIRLDTPKERAYYSHGGILHYVLRQLAA